MADENEQLSDRERARIKGRERKTQPPRLVVDNPGLKKLALHLAEKRRAQAAAGRAGPPPRRRST